MHVVYAAGKALYQVIIADGDEAADLRSEIERHDENVSFPFALAPRPSRSSVFCSSTLGSLDSVTTPLRPCPSPHSQGDIPGLYSNAVHQLAEANNVWNDEAPGGYVNILMEVLEKTRVVRLGSPNFRRSSDRRPTEMKLPVSSSSSSSPGVSPLTPRGRNRRASTETFLALSPRGTAALGKRPPIKARDSVPTVPATVSQADLPRFSGSQ